MMTSAIQRRVQRTRHHEERLRVTLHPDDMKGHRAVRMGRFVLAGKHLSGDRKIILRFENQYSMESSQWDKVGRNGVIRLPVEYSVARAYLEGMSYTLYLYQW